MVQSLPLHFPNCMTVSLELKSALGYQNMPYILPALARLSRMTGLSLKLVCKMPQPLACRMLYSMHAQQPSLRELTLTIHRPHEWLDAEDVHMELGGFTQLTRLCLTLDDMDVLNPLSYAAVQHLSGLKQLQHLAIWANWDDRLWRYDGGDGFPVLPAQLLPALTGLTRLESNLSSVDIAGLSGCVNLQHLAVCNTAQSFQLAPADWAGLAQLTCLTELRLMNAVLREASQDACAALSKLTRLQVAAAEGWSETFLPALTACVRLTEIFGTWQSLSSSVRPAPTLPQVLVLNSPTAGGDPGYYERFPNVRRLREEVLVDGTQHLFDFAMEPSGLRALCKHCTGLQELVLTAECSSLEPEAAPLDCVAAIQSLTALQHLTRLDFTLCDNFEFLALVRACSVLDGHSLQELYVSDGYDSCVTAGAWMQLSALRRLRKLSAAISSKETYDGLAKEAAVFLGALSGCGTVLLKLPGSAAPFENTLSALREAGLPPLPVEFVGK